MSDGISDSHDVRRPTDLTRYVSNPDILDCPLGDGLAVFDSRNGVYFNFNRTAALIWDRARTPAARSELRAALIGAAPRSVCPDDIDRDLDSLLHDLVTAGLMTMLPEDGMAAPARG